MKRLCICVGLVNAKTTILQQTISISWYMHQLVINSAYFSSGVAAGDSEIMQDSEINCNYSERAIQHQVIGLGIVKGDLLSIKNLESHVCALPCFD